MKTKNSIISEITLAGHPYKEVAISMEDFFEGNNFLDSIGVNLYPQPGPQYFYEVLKCMLDMSVCERILVRIVDYEDSDWFYSDTVNIIGDLKGEDIRKMTDSLNPDLFYEGWMYGKPANVPETNSKIFSLWWD